MTVIATERLLLRRLHEGDGDDLVRGLNNFEVSRWTSRIPYPYTAEDAAAFLEVCARPEPGTLRLALALAAQLIGVISYEHSGPGVAEIGYWIAQPHWGQGFGTEAARAMAGHAFGEGGYAEMIARYTLGNTASRRILLGLGFIETGTGRQFSRATGREDDIMRLSLSKSSWESARGRQR